MRRTVDRGLVSPSSKYPLLGSSESNGSAATELNGTSALCDNASKTKVAPIAMIPSAVMRCVQVLRLSMSFTAHCYGGLQLGLERGCFCRGLAEGGAPSVPHSNRRDEAITARRHGRIIPLALPPRSRALRRAELLTVRFTSSTRVLGYTSRTRSSLETKCPA